MSYRELYTEHLRVNFLKYTREAFRFLPEMKKPKILDIGCGSGILSIELARLTDGNIYAIDVDQSLLDRFRGVINKENLANRITLKRMDLIKNNFPDNYFDLIWEEGVVHIIGFKKSFTACHRILKQGGYLVLGQAIKLMEKNQAIVSDCGYELIKQINWPKGCWWYEFYEPLEIIIKEIYEGKRSNKFENISIIEEEIKWAKSNPNETDCAHYILQKKSTRGK